MSPAETDGVVGVANLRVTDPASTIAGLSTDRRSIVG